MFLFANKLDFAKAATLLTLLAAVGAMLSTLYEWGYLTAIGVSFSSVGYTIADVSTGLVRTMPWSIVAALPLVLLLDFPRMNTPLNPDNDLRIEEVEVKKIEAFMLRVVDTIPWALLIFPIFLYGLLGQPFESIVIFAALSTPTIFFPRTGISRKLGVLPIHYLTISSVIMMASVAFVFGYMGSSKDVGRTKPPAFQKIYYGDGKQERGKILRIYEKGVLIYNGSIIYVKSENISRFETEMSQRKVGVPCYVANVLCLDE